jgi:tRNA/tmRNA/rRNA uracil-C5-methylase (TrmA/RlmC/RlmD family)
VNAFLSARIVAEWDYLMPDELLISIEKLVYGGDGLAHADGNTVFVPYVLPGEQVRATAKSKRKKTVWAQLLEVTSPSAQREGARCPHFQTCGGCHYQHIPAAEQLAEERDFAGDAFAAGRNSVDWPDSGAFSGALRISQSRAVGSARR